MSPHSCQQLPFSAFSLTFCFDKGFCPSTAAAWEVGRGARPHSCGSSQRPRPGLGWASGLLLLSPERGVFSQKILWVKLKFLLWLHYSFKLPGHTKHERSLSLLTQGLTGEGGGGEESGEERVQRYFRLLPQKLNQPIKICSCFLPPRRDRVNSGSVFRRSPRAGLVLLSLFFRCRACSAACGFLFLCAYVGAHFFKLKRRKSKWIVKLVFFRQSWLFVSFRSRWEINVSW